MGLLRIRLARFGCRNRPFYRLVAIDSRKPRDAMPIEYVSFRTYRRQDSGPPAGNRDKSTLPAARLTLQLGTYNPIPYGLDTTKEVRLRLDRIKYWLSVGAQPSDRVNFLLWRAGLMPAPPIHFTPTQWVPKKVLREQAKKFHSMSEAQLSAGRPSAGPSRPHASAYVAPKLASFSGLFSRPAPCFMR